MKKEIKIDLSGRIDFKRQSQEIKIKEGESIQKDFIEFVDALHTKLKFKDKNKFVKDMFAMVSQINPKTALDFDKLSNSFFIVLRDNMSDPTIMTNKKMAAEELNNVVRIMKNG